MAPTPWAEARTLLGLARASIEHGMRHGRALEVDLERYPPSLREPRAAFVSLHRHGELRGCTGSLEPSAALVAAVAESAFRTAFRDPRFAPLEASELSALDIHISILSPLEPFPVGSEAELCERLRPGIDGLVLRDGPAVGTFLPSVWRSLPAPRDFVAELKHKAGLSRDHWSASLGFQRYTVEEIS